MTFLGNVMPLGGTCTNGFPIFVVKKAQGFKMAKFYELKTLKTSFDIAQRL